MSLLVALAELMHESILGTFTKDISLPLFCGFIVDWKPILTYATFDCKISAGCF